MLSLVLEMRIRVSRPQFYIEGNDLVLLQNIVQYEL